MFKSNQQRLDGLASEAKQWVDVPIFKEGEKAPEADSRHWTFGETTTAHRGEAARNMAEVLGTFVRYRPTQYEPVGVISGVPFKAKYSYQNSCVYVQDPTGRMLFSIEVDDLRPGVIDREELEKKWPGIRIRTANESERPSTGMEPTAQPNQVHDSDRPALSSGHSSH